MKKGRLILISGVAEAGKHEIVNRVIANNENCLRATMVTTRKPRLGETSDDKCVFITTEEFEECLKNDMFIEYARYDEHYYGTYRSHIEEALSEGKDVILEINIPQAVEIKNTDTDAIAVFVTTVDEQNNNELYKPDYLIVNNDLDMSVQELNDIVNGQK